MIGGTDIVIPTRGGNAPLDLCLRVIQRYWPEAVFEDALTGDRYDRYESLPIGRLKEVLVYHDGRSAKEWDEKGADPSLENTMIHLLFGDKSITVVVDDAAEPAMRKLLDSIQFALGTCNGPNNEAQAPEAHRGKSKTCVQMKELYLLGYAPAQKEAWPHGGLQEDLEPLDLRHGVAPNLVFTPILSAACYLSGPLQAEFLSYVRKQILEGDENGKHRRYNVLTRTVGMEQTEIESDVRLLFTMDKVDSFKEKKEVYLVFSYWAVTALLSYLVCRKDRWTKEDLKEFGEIFLSSVLRILRLAEILKFPDSLPKNAIPRLGLFFRICTQGNEEEVGPLLLDCMRNFPGCHLTEEHARWIVAVIRSLVPLPHNEVYQGYRKGTNPIGKYQACFVCCQDSSNMEVESTSRLMWQYVGEAIATRLEGASA